MGKYKLAAVCRLMAIVCLGLASSACATIISGTTQDLYVDSEPKGASCKIDRQGAVVGTINPTPGKVNVPRHKDNIVVACALDATSSPTRCWLRALRARHSATSCWADSWVS